MLRAMRTAWTGSRAWHGAPLIAVTTSEVRVAALDAPAEEADPPREEMALGLRYLQAVERAGGIPVAVTPLGMPAMEALLDRVDGICLSGGPDIHPSAYGHQPAAELGPTEPALDAFEIALARAADRRGLPILGICRGAQLLNVARGGTLRQHVPGHRQRQHGSVATHPVRVAPESRLRTLLGAQADVNSFHHQTVDELGARLVPAAWAPDGVLEAYEAQDWPLVVGVQWHAECLVDRPEQLALFQALVAASSAAAKPPVSLAS
jgi:putative glutamine amidotransferase